jgi:hypothetical protein
MWDEARVITNQQLTIGTGLSAPRVRYGKIIQTETLFSDTINFFQRSKT